jgi:uncharacterized damage-inducible protein DinB
MNRRSVSRAARAAFLSALAISLGAAPTLAQKATLVEDFAAMNGKFTSLAGAMGADTYGWRPMEGVRSVGEVYMLIAAEAYYMPSLWGGEPPAGMEINNQIFADLAAVTDKADVLEHLEKAFAYCTEAFEALPPEKLSEEISFFGQQRTVGAAVFLLLGDMHEHLGQAIAYARSNKVVPPWSAGG